MATHSIRLFPLHFPTRGSPCAIGFQTISTTDWTVTDAVITAVPAPDDGCQHPKHVEL